MSWSGMRSRSQHTKRCADSGYQIKLLEREVARLSAELEGQKKNARRSYELQTSARKG